MACKNIDACTNKPIVYPEEVCQFLSHFNEFIVIKKISKQELQIHSPSCLLHQLEWEVRTQKSQQRVIFLNAQKIWKDG